MVKRGALGLDLRNCSDSSAAVRSSLASVPARFFRAHVGSTIAIQDAQRRIDATSCPAYPRRCGGSPPAEDLCGHGCHQAGAAGVRGRAGRGAGAAGGLIGVGSGTPTLSADSSSNRGNLVLLTFPAPAEASGPGSVMRLEKESGTRRTRAPSVRAVLVAFALSRGRLGARACRTRVGFVRRD